MKISAIILTLILTLSNLYAQIYKEQTDIVIKGIYDGCVDWGDYNNDGLLDFMIAGYEGDIDMGYSAIYKNNGNNSFIEISGILQPVESCNLDWGDYNNDNYIDIILTGGYDDHSSYTKYSQIYKNNTEGSFVHQLDISLTKAAGGVAKWGDYSNDGYSDIFLSGSSLLDWIAKIYTNDRNENFTELTQLEILGVVLGSLSWGDYNNDGLLDFIYMGRSIDDWVTKIYKNIGNGYFLPLDNSDIINVSYGSVEWGDYNNDGYLDFIISGQNNSAEFQTKIYKNNGNESFSELNDINIIGISLGSTIWGDYDNDGLLDVLATGWSMDGGLGELQARIYKNMGNDLFNEQTDISLTPVGGASSAFCDYDNDQDLDILLTGLYDTALSCSKIFKNNISTFNTAPDIIQNLHTETVGNTVYFSWDEATDSNQASEGLSYNIYVYEQDNPLPYIASPQAFPQTHELNGKRTLAQRGYIQGIREDGRVTYFLKDVFEQGKTYYWSVQAIDASFAGGEFAPEQSFVYDSTANLHDINSNNLSISPNPSNGIFIIKNISDYIDQDSEISISISNFLGREIYKNHLSGKTGEIYIDLSNHQRGIYFITIQNEKFKQTQKIIIN